MTEADWHSIDVPDRMFQFIRRGANRRKLRLFACACCRRIWPLLVDPRSRAAVEWSEQYADGQTTKERLSAAQAAASRALQDAEVTLRSAFRPQSRVLGVQTDEAKAAAYELFLQKRRRTDAARAAKSAARSTDRQATLAEEAGLVAQWARMAQSPWISPNRQEVHHYQSQVLRCVFGNPFRVARLGTDGLAPRTVSLAGEMYATGRFDTMPTLADMLESDGCSQEAIAHCRDQGPHVKGCWVVDLARPMET